MLRLQEECSSLLVSSKPAAVASLFVPDLEAMNREAEASPEFWPVLSSHLDQLTLQMVQAADPALAAQRVAENLESHLVL